MKRGRIAPALERARAHARVDHDERHFGAAGLDDHVGPELGFGDQAEIGAPMGEKAAHEAGRVERRELVEGAGRQAPLQQPRRGDGAGRHQRAAAALGQPFDQRQQRQRLADAGAVQPDQRARRARDCPASPRRSSSRSASSLPRLSRSESSGPASGVASRVASR